MKQNHREIVNEAQRRLIEAGVTLGQLAGATEKSRQAASGWMSGKKLPTPETRDMIAARWPECQQGLWDVIPSKTKRATTPPPPPPPEDEGDDADMSFVGRLRAHAVRVEREMAEAKTEGRMQDLVKLMTLKQKILMDGAKFTGELTAAEESRLTRSAKFVAIKMALAKALAPYPDAGKAVEDALLALGV